MTQLNSAFKVEAEQVATTTGIVPEKGAVLFDLSIPGYVMGDGTNWLPVLIEPYSDTYWLDMLGPLSGQRIDLSSGRVDMNYFNGALGFQANARYPEEVVMARVQIQHYWKVGTNGKPHLHWKQQSANIPNWLLGWKLSKNGEADLIETDYSNFNFGVLQSQEFTYTSGVLNQISNFPDIDLSTAGISDMLTLSLWRDTGNVSTLFAGADPSAITELATDLDIHIEVDMPGSRQEYIK
jgi:hypothetical protein